MSVLSLDLALADLANYYYRTTQPMIYAAYLCGANDDEKRYECVDTLTEILRRPPTHETFYALNMMGLIQQGADTPAAIELFGDAISFDCPSGPCISDPVRASAFSNRGWAFFEVGNVRNAVKDLEVAARLAPDDSAILTNFGVALTSAARYNEAAVAFETALSSNSEFALAYLERGNLKLVIGQSAAAVSDFAQAIRRDPACAEAYAKRAELLRSSGHLQAAERDEKRARLLRLWSNGSTKSTQTAQAGDVKF